ncbi:MAG: hypothetical protein M3401_06155, partial [Actinomycetota bacterium]|nr:hypothetical protein [Actinomycetota bacterium]
MSTTTTSMSSAAEPIGWRQAAIPSRHELYAQRVAALRNEIQSRVDARLAQGFTAREALAYAAPLLRAARRGRV